jgi:hypothetical protein
VYQVPEVFPVEMVRMVVMERTVSVKVVVTKHVPRVQDLPVSIGLSVIMIRVLTVIFLIMPCIDQ